MRGVDERPAVRERDAHAAHEVEQRDARVHQRESGRVDRLGEHVAVGREHFNVDVHLEACGGGRDESGGRGAHQRRCSAGGPAREAGWRQDYRSEDGLELQCAIDRFAIVRVQYFSVVRDYFKSNRLK